MLVLEKNILKGVLVFGVVLKQITTCKNESEVFDMRLYKSNLNLFVKNKICLITYLVVNLIMIFSTVITTIKADPFFDTALLKEENLLMLTSVIFIMFLFISFIYFSKSKYCELNECIGTTKKGKNSFLFNQFLVISTFAFITFVFSFLLSVFISLKFGITENQYLIYLFKVCFFYYFLVDIIAILLGLLCSFINNKSLSYVSLFILAILFSPIINRIPNIVFMINEKVNLFPFFDLIEIYPTNFKTINHSYGFAANIHSFYKILFWILMCATIVFLVCSFRKKWVKIVASLLSVTIFAMCTVNLFAPYSEVPHNLDPKKGFACEAWHYLPTDFSKSPMQYDEKSDFNVTSYFINCNIKDYFIASAHMEIDNKDLQEYKFTLYRGFEIIDISNGKGKAMPYERNGDYITVHRYEDYDSDYICIFYKGSSPTFYSNTQGTYLPGGFPYYPISGFHYLYDIRNQGRIGIKLDENIPITLRVDSDKEIFCNLERTEDKEEQIYSGVTNALTIVDGFYKEVNVDGSRLIYKYLDKSELLDKNVVDVFSEYLEKYPQYKGKTIIICPENHSLAKDEKRFEASDHIVANSLGEAFKGSSSEQNSLKNYMDLYYAFLKYFDEDSELYRLTTKDIGELTNDEDLNVVLAKQIIKNGVQNTYTNILNIQLDDFKENSSVDLVKSFD